MDWQQASYVATTFGMMVIAIVGILFLILFYNLYRLSKKIDKTIEEGGRLVEDVYYFQKGVRLGIIRFLLKIVGKGANNE